MRVTDTSTIAIAQIAQRESISSLNRVYEQIATGKKINHISDNPVAFVRSELLEANMRENDQFTKTMGVLRLEYGKYETHLDTLENVTLRVNEMILQGKNGSLDPASREGFVIELEAARDEILSVLNGKDGDRYIFSGTEIFTPAVDAAPPYAPTANNDKREVQVSDTVNFVSNVTAIDLVTNSDILNNIDAVISEFKNPTVNFEQVAQDGIDSTLQFQEDILGQLSAIGGRINAVDRMIVANEDVAVYSEAVRSELVETDYAEASITLSKHMNTLEASQKTFMQLMNNSLFDLF
ncbi:flagellar hook-associated protein 3 [Vibrio owensii]|uniref:flagellin N-terminal helical domain-containing protein n=1 Tax=Vibrio owensii TaxID=696485 RepID=UPI0018F20F67|nr:flagellar hook-associated protein 3 [Vibrio owensii]